MKKALNIVSTCVILLVMTACASAQNEDFYTKNGVVLNGYDLVSYFENGAIKGNKDFSTVTQGATFYFASQKNLNTFLKNPKAYLPAYGGYCAYAIAKNGKKVKVDPETYEIRDGKLYLFYNAWGTNTLNKWLEEDPKALQTQADKAWSGL